MTAVCHTITPPVTVPLSVLAMSPLCYSDFFRCYALLLKAFLPTLLTPSRPTPALLMQTGTQGYSKYLFYWGRSCHSWRKNGFAANLHMDRITVVGEAAEKLDRFSAPQSGLEPVPVAAF